MKIQFARQRPGKMPTELWENLKLKCSEISTFQKREIKIKQE